MEEISHLKWTSEGPGTTLAVIGSDNIPPDSLLGPLHFVNTGIINLILFGLLEWEP